MPESIFVPARTRQDRFPPPHVPEVQMKALQQFRMYARFGAGLPGFLRNTISLADAQAIVRRGIEQREENFLRLMDRGVLRNSGSPYAKLLRLAQCEFGDLEGMVRRRGLQPALRSLRDAGVYVTFEELKGREPIVRQGKTFEVATSDFANPLLSRAYQSDSGGSTGAGIRVDQDLDHLAIQAAHFMLAFSAHNVLDVPHGIWRGVLPDGSGINNVLRCSRFGRVPAKWFSPTRLTDPKPPLRFAMATYGTVLIGRTFGVPLPWPESVPIEQAAVVARWAAETARKHGGCVVSAPVSRALRVSIAAQDSGLDLSGVTFVIAGEPPTPAKVAGIHASGARCFTTYGFTEAGRVAMGCTHPVSGNDLHVLRDAFEVFPVPHTVPGTDTVVDALNITSLLLTSPLILLNAELDDYGVVETRSCGCALEALGYDLHVRDIHSYRKLTGEGVTLVGGEMIDVIERVLPARFGGSPLDYQLMEEEDEHGFTRLSLLVSPRVRIEDESQVIPAVLEQLQRSSVMAASAKGIWAQAGTLRLKRMDPVWTGRGKLLPLHLIRRNKPADGPIDCSDNKRS